MPLAIEKIDDVSDGCVLYVYSPIVGWFAGTRAELVSAMGRESADCRAVYYRIRFPDGVEHRLPRGHLLTVLGGHT